MYKKKKKKKKLNFHPPSQMVRTLEQMFLKIYLKADLRQHCNHSRNVTDLHYIAFWTARHQEIESLLDVSELPL